MHRCSLSDDKQRQLTFARIANEAEVASTSGRCNADSCCYKTPRYGCHACTAIGGRGDVDLAAVNGGMRWHAVDMTHNDRKDRAINSTALTEARPAWRAARSQAGAAAGAAGRYACASGRLAQLSAVAGCSARRTRRRLNHHWPQTRMPSSLPFEMLHAEQSRRPGILTQRGSSRACGPAPRRRESP